MITNTSTHLTIRLFRGSLVTFAAAAMGLAFGVLYTWSVVKAGIPDSWGWSNADKALPYSIMCITFSLSMVPAGRLQDRYGPRWVVLLGGFLVGLGCVVAGLGGSSKLAYLAGFGLLTGCGVGFGYSALTPAAIKWFPPGKTGLIVGIVVAGNGLAPLFLAPFCNWLLSYYSLVGADGVVEKGVSQTMMALGVAVWVLVGVLFGLIANPPGGFVAARDRQDIRSAGGGTESGWKQMLAAPQFWLLYLMYFAGSAAGLTFISVAADLGKRALGELSFIAVMVLALGNTLGRIMAGALSDRFGRQLTLFVEFMFQGVMIFALFLVSKNGAGGWPAILAVLFFIGLNYGANLSIFPAACKDSFGIRYFGLNYGCLFTAFGVAGLVMPLVNGMIKDRTGSLDLSYFLIIAMMLIAALLALVSRKLSRRSSTLGQRG